MMRQPCDSPAQKTVGPPHKCVTMRHESVPRPFALRPLSELDSVN
jgi:hypothetical protein